MSNWASTPDVLQTRPIPVQNLPLLPDNDRNHYQLLTAPIQRGWAVWVGLDCRIISTLSCSQTNNNNNNNNNSRLVHFSCCSWCQGSSQTRCIPQRGEIGAFSWSLYVCSHCLRELGSTKRFNLPAPFIPWPKIDGHFRRKLWNQLPVSEMLSLGTVL